MKVIIDIDEEDFRIMQHNVAVDNPLCPLSEKEIVTKIANGMSIFNNAISRDVFDKIEEERLFDCNNIGFEAKFINAIPIPDDATCGDVIKAMFPNYTIQINSICESVSVYYEGTEEYSGSWFRFDLNWWNAPYKKKVE